MPCGSFPVKGCNAVRTEAASISDEDARHYYEQYGFMVLPDSPLKLFLPLAKLKQALV
jgi:hypothetical protein